MSKKYITSTLLLFFVSIIFAQENGIVSFELPANNSLKFNKFVINPAFSYVKEEKPTFALFNKRQWTGFDNAPQTYFLSYSGKVRENNAIATGVFQQTYGLFSTTGLLANYARNVLFNDESNLTFGLNLAGYRSGIDAGKVITNTPDPALDNFPTNTLISISPGLNYGTGLFDFGIAAKNLIFYNLKTSKLLADDPLKSIDGHIMYTGYLESDGLLEGSKFSAIARGEMRKDVTVLATTIMLNAPKAGWVQAGYNSIYGISAGAGFTVAKDFSLGLTYEKAMGKLADRGSGLEFVLAYHFEKSDDDTNYVPVNTTTYAPIKANEIQPADLAKIKAEQELKKQKELELAKAKIQEQIARAEAEAKAKADRLAKESQMSQKEKDALAAKTLADAEKLRLVAEAKAKLVEANRSTREKARLAAEAKIKADEAARIAKEEAAAKAKQVADAKALADAEKARLAAEAKIKADQAAKLTNDQATTNAKQAADAKAIADAEKARIANDDKIKANEAAAKAKQAADAKAIADAEKARLAAEAKIKTDEAARIAKEEAAAKAKQAADAKAIADAEKARLAAEAKIKTDEAAKIAKEEAAAKAKQAADAKAIAAAEKARLAAEAKIKTDEAARIAKEEAAAKAKQAADAKAIADAEKARLAAEAKIKTDEAARIAKEEAAAKAKQAADAKAIADAEKARLAAEAKIKTDEAARIAKEEAAAKAKQAADAKAIADAEKARLAAEAKIKTDEAARIAKEEAVAKAKQAADAKTKADSEKARLAAEAKIKADAIAKQKADAEAEKLRKDLEDAKIAATKDDNDRSIDYLGQVIYDNNKTISQGIKRLDSIAKIRQNDLNALKTENDTGIINENLPFQSASVAKKELESLKAEIAEASKSQTEFISQFDNLIKERLKKVPNKNDEINLQYQKSLDNLRAEKIRLEQISTGLDLKLDKIGAELEVEKKRRIKRAVFENGQSRYTKDRETLANLKANTPKSTSSLKPEDFDFGDNENNMQILKKIENATSGFYIVLAVHKDVAKRDTFVSKVIASGETNIDFLFNVASGKYFIYTKKFDNLTEATRALEKDTNKAFESRRFIIKIEN
jgi:type IX secretion system PorP/SprF family membrane protein